MRTIKFRAWEKTKNKMFFPSSISWKEGKILCLNWSEEDVKEAVLEDAILMQFTGLKDKNGVEIFEGDILLLGLLYYSERETPQRFIVSSNDFYGDCCYLEAIQQGLQKLIDIGEDEERKDTDFIEVIGNVHNNPELLKGEGND